MPAKLKEAPLNNRTARAKLAPAGKPYWRLATDGLHLGYRRVATKGRAGSWVARRRNADGVYLTAGLGTADDLPDVPADGIQVMTFDQAMAALRDWARDHAQRERAATHPTEPTPTVRKAVEEYIAGRLARSAKAGRDAELRLGRHVLLAPLADATLSDLTDGDLKAWRKGLKRGGRAGKGKALPLAPATLARLLNDLRAALAETGVPAEKTALVKKALKAPENAARARDVAILSDADVRRVLDGAYQHDPDFGALVMILAATGCRFDQAARIKVADFQPDAGRVMVPVSRKGRGTKQIPYAAVPLPDDVVKRLRPLVAGRAGHEPLLMHWHHRQVPGDTKAGTLPGWERDGRRPWSVAADMSRPWKATVEAIGLPTGTVPYALRHSSIVRGLRAGLPARLVAAAHDTSTAMIEKHYSAFIMDAAGDLLRRAMLPLAPAEVVTLRREAAATSAG